MVDNVNYDLLDRLSKVVDKGGEPPDDERMEARLTKLEDFAADAKERLVKLELRLEQTATKTDIAEIRGDMHKASTDISRWMIATVISLFLGFGGLFFVMSNATKPAASPPPAQPPIIIYTQPAPPGTPAAPAK